MALIEGEPLTVREYRWHLDCNRPMVIREILADHEVPNPARFWSAPLDGQTPWERLRDQSLDYALHFKAEQMLAREQGLASDLGYGAFRQRWFAENRRRDEESRHGRGGRAPRHLSEAEFYFVAQRELHARLLARLAETELAVSDEEVRGYLEAHRNRFEARVGPRGRERESPAETMEREAREGLLEEKYRRLLDEAIAEARIVFDDLALDEQRRLVDPAWDARSRPHPERSQGEAGGQ